MRFRLVSIIAILALAAYAAAPTSALARGRGGGGGNTDNVDCSHATPGTFSTIGAAITDLQKKGPNPQDTINVSGACHENVVIQSMDRLTLNANLGASITDASGGNMDVIQILDSRDVSINNFTINGGDGGINCLDGSFCRLTGNTFQNAAGSGVAVSGLSQAVVSGGTIQGSEFAAIDVRNGSSASVLGVMIANNPGIGMNILGQSFVLTNSTIANNGSSGVFLRENAYFRCSGCQITGNADIGIIVKRDSSARFLTPYAVTGNTGGGVQLTESSSAFFDAGTVTGNSGGMDVFCGSSFTTARGAAISIGGGTTNCVEPSP
jgi:hypothetical protein